MKLILNFVGNMFLTNSLTTTKLLLNPNLPEVKISKLGNDGVNFQIINLLIINLLKQANDMFRVNDL